MPVDVDAVVVANTRLSDEYNVLALRAPAIARAVRPGQFVMLRATPAGSDPLLRRPFSIFEVLRDARGAPIGISVLNKRVGVGTRLLYGAQPSTVLACLGPLGRPFPPVDPPAEAFLVAGGVGLAPFLTLAEALAARGTRTTLFYGARRAADLFFADRFADLGVRLELATEDGSLGHRGLVTAPLEAALARAAGAVVIYACGPTPMMAAAARLAREAGRRCLVSLEPTMGCGLGGCYSCVVPVARDGEAHFVRACVEGPVFDAAAIRWDRLAAR
jgi:dihydroorotate dehydrogenase electron transfer subunit